jgi:integrase
MTKTELIEKVNAELAGSSKSTIFQFKSIAARYYDFSNGSFTRDSVVKYIKNMERKHYAAATRAMHYRVLKRIFDMAHKLDSTVEWSFAKRAPSELPIQVADWDVKAPAIPIEELKTIIDGAKDSKLPSEWTALVAVSSIYGLRRIEMMELSPDSIDLSKGVLRVVTAKHGRLRAHLIPEEIKPYLEDYPFGKYSEYQLSQVYHDIRDSVGLPRAYGTGWHSCRRALDSQLLFIFPYPVVRTFLRWKKSSMDMPMRYWSPPEGEVDEIVFGLRPFVNYTGELVYGKHPFLKLWC